MYTEMQDPSISNTVMRKEIKIGQLVLPGFKTKYKAMII